MIEHRGQAKEGQGGETEAEVAQSDIEISADQEKVHDNAGKPGGDNRSAELRLKGDEEPGDDFDGATGS